MSKITVALSLFTKTLMALVLAVSLNSQAVAQTTTPVVSDAMNQIFELAESKLSEFFPSGAITLFLDQYVYRYYPQTDVYLAFADDTVFLLGGVFGAEVVNAGPIADVLTLLDEYEGSVDAGTGGDVSGDLWTLTITGSFSTALIPNLDFDGLQITNVPAPDLTNADEINTQVIESLDGIATGIASLEVTVITNTDTQRIFEVSFSANLDSLGAVTYNLRYAYTR